MLRAKTAQLNDNTNVLTDSLKAAMTMNKMSKWGTALERINEVSNSFIQNIVVHLK